MLNFFNPLLLWGALAFAVPLIIHLLNRQRFRRRAWAAMEFLLAAYKKQRRRVRTENLLLLILRCLIPILLALAIARPVLRSVAGLVGIGSTAHHVLVIDASYSMGVEPPGAPSPFAQAKSLATRLLDRVARQSGHKVSIVVAGVRPTTPVVDDLNVARAKAQLAVLGRPFDGASDLTAALVAAAELVENGSDPEYRVHVFTDLQVRALGLDKTAGAQGDAARAPDTPPGETPPADAFKDTIADAVERLRKKAELTFFDVGPEAGAEHLDNLQVTDLRLLDELAVVRTPLPLQVTLHNRGESPRAVQVTVEIDGGAPVRQAVTLEALADKTVEFPLTFLDVGLRTVKASIESDGLDADDVRYLVVEVRDRVKLLLVEGSDETEAPLQDASHVRAILDPGAGDGDPSLTPFQPRTIDTLQFWTGNEPFADYDLVALCNVEAVPAEVAEKLKNAMQGGTSLFVMTGGRCKADSYNANLHVAGQGPVPLQLHGPLGFAPLGDESYGAEIVDPDHPVFQDLGEVFRDIFQQLPIYKFMGSDATTLHRDARIIARLRDPQQSPLLTVGAWGEGRVAVLSTTITRRPDRWNDLQLEMIAFQFLHPLARWLTVSGASQHNIVVGGAIGASLRDKPRDVAYLTSERAGSMRIPTGEDGRPLPGNRYALPPCRDTAFSGIYLADLQVEKDGVLTPRQLPFAVNVEPVEGDLRYAAHGVVRERLGVERIHRELPAEGSTAIDSGANELGPMLLLAAFLFLLGEGALARYVSTRRGG